jgi:AP2-associated kinase
MKDMDATLTRSRSLNIQQRPASVPVGAGPVHSKDKHIKHITTSDYETNFVSAEPEAAEAPESDMNIQSNVEFLRAREEEEKERRGHHKRVSSGSRHSKRSSLPHIALSGTKNLLTGRFGDAFKMFEGGHERPPSRDRHEHEKTEPLLSQDRRDVLTPIAGSEATDLSDDRRLEDAEDLPPAMRREIEKRQLEAEERRVEQAAAEYRQRVAARGGGAGGGGGAGVSRAATIQNKVQSLLSENNQPAQKTATGYGRFTNEIPQQSSPSVSQSTAKTPVDSSTSASTTSQTTPLSAPPSDRNIPAHDARPRPTAPPKPKVLRTGQGNLSSQAPAVGGDAMSPDDWEAKFSKRFPSLSGIEMVETDLDSKSPSTRIREV